MVRGREGGCGLRVVHVICISDGGRSAPPVDRPTIRSWPEEGVKPPQTMVGEVGAGSEGTSGHLHVSPS